MRIKRIIALVLCLVMMLALAGCGKDEIGAYLDVYKYEPEKTVNMEFDFYIIVGEGTTTRAMTTVKDKINQYLGDKYNTKLNINYISAAEYEAVANATVDASVSSDVILADKDENKDGIIDPLRVNAGKIVLVTGADMMNRFVGTGKLYNLSDFLTTNEFGTLNTSIPEVLIDAARGANGELFCIPNNHLIGHYEYVCINRAEALKHNYSDQTELRRFVSDEDITTLKSVIGDANVVVETGPYEMRAQKEAEGWICNIRQYPKATAEEAYKSAFAIIPETTVYFDANNDGLINDLDHKDYNRDKTITPGKETGCLADKTEVARRAMEVVYAINSDSVLRNYLQYGIEGINYKCDANGTVVYEDGEDTRYHMPLEYTGDIFKAKFIETPYAGQKPWTAEMYINYMSQNNEAK